MTVYRWADGFHPPKDVTAQAVGEVIARLDEPTPEALYEGSKKTDHLLHTHIWAEGDQIWARKARLEECRKILTGCRVVYTVGPKEITVKAVEFLRHNGHTNSGQWTHIEDILANKKLHRPYMEEIRRLQEQALKKMDAFITLLHKDDN